MTTLSAIWAWFSALGWIGKLTAGLGALTPLAALNPLMSILTVIWTAIKTVIGWIFEGFQNVIAHPVTLSIVVIAFIGGMWSQHDLDKRKIESYKIDAQNIAKKVQGAADVEKAKAAAAIAARDAAKMLPLFEPNITVAPLASSVAVPPIALNPSRPDFVRPNKVRGRAKCDAVFCF